MKRKELLELLEIVEAKGWLRGYIDGIEYQEEKENQSEVDKNE